jgi:DNA-nicking Smr family endonuclease
LDEVKKPGFPLKDCGNDDTKHSKTYVKKRWKYYTNHMKEDEDFENTEAVELPIDGTLDLHTFHPREVRDLLPEYLTACREKGILEVRIIHGKGTGMLRETVHALLKRLPEVVSFRLAGQDAGSWGATIVRLRPMDYVQREM